ncbi:MAG: hypothetical protein KC591_17260 [Gemmatimonadetes bacterium]|nr:hypothetical protein [Gemmatimonadota bacterium]
MRIPFATFGALGGLAVGIGAALAHPMGNVSISHYAGLEISPAEVRVKYLLDYAEIPAEPELLRVDPNGDDRVVPEERAAYLDAKTAEILRGLRLEVNGKPRELHSVWSAVSFPPGESGLSTVRIAWDLRASLAEGELLPRNFLVWNDTNHEGIGGWKEIRMTALDGLGIARAFPPTAPSVGEALDYPEERLWNPPTDTKGWCHFGVGLAPEAGPGDDAGTATDRPATDRPATDRPADGRGRGRAAPIAIGAAALLLLVAFLARRSAKRRHG